MRVIFRHTGEASLGRYGRERKKASSGRYGRERKKASSDRYFVFKNNVVGIVREISTLHIHVRGTDCLQ